MILWHAHHVVMHGVIQLLHSSLLLLRCPSQLVTDDTETALEDSPHDEEQTADSPGAFLKKCKRIYAQVSSNKKAETIDLVRWEKTAELAKVGVGEQASLKETVGSAAELIRKAMFECT